MQKPICDPLFINTIKIHSYPHESLLVLRYFSRDPERDKLLYSHYFNGVVKDVQAEVEGVLGRTPHFQTVSGLVQKQVPKVGADYKTLTPIKTQLGPDHPLVCFVITELLKKGF
uniref:Uncharacterized protein orf113c n=1 Tax=Beta vulgaris subsp. maritima TaxID=350892 RepID=E8ZC20_BETVM|nr:hypothetical protein [Beta vulgaris subsp. maritima]